MTLAIRTDSPNIELYVLDNSGKQLGVKKWAAGFELSKQILSEIKQLLKKQKIDFHDISGVIVYKGPGSFTALRIGISVGNALAYANKVPIVGENGKNWLEEGTKKLSNTKTGRYVIPEYGAAPHITAQKK